MVVYGQSGHQKADFRHDTDKRVGSITTTTVPDTIGVKVCRSGNIQDVASALTEYDRSSFLQLGR